MSINLMFVFNIGLKETVVENMMKQTRRIENFYRRMRSRQ